MSIQDINKRNKYLYNTSFEKLRLKMCDIINPIQFAVNPLGILNNAKYMDSIFQYKNNAKLDSIKYIYDNPFKNIYDNLLFANDMKIFHKSLYSSVFDNISNIIDTSNYIKKDVQKFSDTITANFISINTSLSGIRELLNGYETNDYFKKIYSNIINVEKDLFYNTNVKIELEIQEDGSIIIDDKKYKKEKVEEIIKDVSSNLKIKKDNTLYKRSEQWYNNNQFKVYMVGAIITIFTTLFCLGTWIFEPEYNNFRDVIREKIGLEAIEEHKELLNNIQDMYTQIVTNEEKLYEKLDNMNVELEKLNAITKEEKDK